MAPAFASVSAVNAPSQYAIASFVALTMSAFVLAAFSMSSSFLGVLSPVAAPQYS